MKAAYAVVPLLKIDLLSIKFTSGQDEIGQCSPDGRQRVITDVAERFLEDTDARDLRWNQTADAPADLSPHRVLFGNGEAPLEVAIAFTEAGAPKSDDVRRLWRLRHNNRPSPVLLAVLYDDAGITKAVTCGIVDGVTELSLDQLGRVCTAGLAEPDRHAAQRALERLLAAVKDQPIPGLTNQGLFATHELHNGVPHRPDWSTAVAAARPLLKLRGLSLIDALGYDTTPRGSAAVLLTHRGTSRSIAVLLEDEEVFDRPSPWTAATAAGRYQPTTAACSPRILRRIRRVLSLPPCA